MLDEASLNDMAALLVKIAGYIQSFSQAAARSERRGGHEQFNQINHSLTEIRDLVEHLNTKDDHSADYKRIERSLTAIVAAVRQLADSPPSPR